MTLTGRLHALVLAGGTGRRLGGASKPDLVVGGRTLLAWTLASLPREVSTVVVVAPPGVGVPAGVLRTLEDPPLGGPACGVAAGWRSLERRGVDEGDTVALLACDAPDSGRVLPDLVGALRTSLHSPDGGEEVALAQVEGRWQFLPAVLTVRALASACQDLAGERDASMRRLYSGLTRVGVRVEADLLADIDDWEDLQRFTRIRGSAAIP